MTGGRRTLERGPLPARLGATVTPDGISFAVFSRNAEAVELCLFEGDGEGETARLALPCRSGDIHHGILAGADAGPRYGLRARGPWQPEQGHRFDATKLLIDPYATRIDRPFRWDPLLAQRGEDTAGLVPRCVVEPSPFGADLEESHKRASKNAPGGAGNPAPSLIYELAVKSFTMRHPAVPKTLRGTLAALTEPAILDHLRTLGVSHVELMPVAAWMDERHLPPLGLSNAWGYNPVNFFALDPRLAPGGAADLAKLCAVYAQAGIGVLLDIVFNHTAESDEFGAIICLRGLDNAVYYRHAADDPGRLINDTGCGHTLALDRAPVVRMAMDALRHWRSLGVSGFRFDLGTVMGRSDVGFSPDAPLLAAIAQDPDLSRAILIMEPWDIGPGGYRLGEFPHPFAEWNGRYRDDIRRFWRGDAGMAGALATRLAGSSDLFAKGHRGPNASINYIAAHDGFPLADLVTYAGKHNEANGEGNRLEPVGGSQKVLAGFGLVDLGEKLACLVLITRVAAEREQRIRRKGDEAIERQTTGDVLDVRVQAAVFMDDQHSRQLSFGIGRLYKVTAHRAVTLGRRQFNEAGLDSRVAPGHLLRLGKTRAQGL